MELTEKQKEKFLKLLCEWNIHKLDPNRALATMWAMFKDEVLPYWREHYCQGID